MCEKLILKTFKREINAKKVVKAILTLAQVMFS